MNVTVDLGWIEIEAAKIRKGLKEVELEECLETNLQP
jgi:hypothetical protein